MLALGIARHLGADDTPCVRLRRGPANPPETAPVDPLDLERAGARAVMRAHGGDDVERQGSAPGLTLQNIGMSQPGREPVKRSRLSPRSTIAGFITLARP